MAALGVVAVVAEACGCGCGCGCGFGGVGDDDGCWAADFRVEDAPSEAFANGISPATLDCGTLDRETHFRRLHENVHEADSPVAAATHLKLRHDQRHVAAAGAWHWTATVRSTRSSATTTEARFFMAVGD